MQGVVIECRNALEIIEEQDTPDTPFFVDPPYVPSTRSKTGYRCELDEQGHRELLATLRGVKGMAVLAGYPSALYDDGLEGWKAGSGWSDRTTRRTAPRRGLRCCGFRRGRGGQ